VAPDEKSENLDQSYLVAPDPKSELSSESYLVVPDEKSEKLSHQKVSFISLASVFHFCGLGRGVVGSEGFSRFPSPHSLVGSDGFVPMSIVPTVQGCDCTPVVIGSASFPLEIHTGKIHMYFVKFVLYAISNTTITSNTDLPYTDSNVCSFVLI